MSLGRQGVGKWLPADHTPRGDLCRMHTAIQSGPSGAGVARLILRCCVVPGDENHGVFVILGLRRPEAHKQALQEEGGWQEPEATRSCLSPRGSGGTGVLNVWPQPPFSFQSPVCARTAQSRPAWDSRLRPQGNPGHGSGCQEWREGKPRCPAHHPSPQKARPHTFGPPGNAGTAGQGRCCVWEVPCGCPNRRGLGKSAPSRA